MYWPYGFVIYIEGDYLKQTLKLVFLPNKHQTSIPNQVSVRDTCILLRKVPGCSANTVHFHGVINQGNKPNEHLLCVL